MVNLRRLSGGLIASAVGVSVLLAVVGAPALPAHAQEVKPPPVRLNEILIQPLEGQYETVEILNGDHKLHDISGWLVTDHDGNDVVLPDKLRAVPPRGIVLIVFDGKGRSGTALAKAEDDLEFEGDNRAVVHTLPGVSGDVFDDLADDCGLYAKGTPSARTIVDFLAFGSLPSSDAANAIRAGIWRAQDVIVTNREGLPYEGAITYLEPGGTLARSERSGTVKAWDHCTPGEATIGSPNGFTAPKIRWPGAGETRLLDPRLDTKQGFAWIVPADAITYDFELAGDPEFRAILVSHAGLDHPNLTIPDMSKWCKPGKTTFYWRVRAVYEKGKGPWSPARDFSMVIPSAKDK